MRYAIPVACLLALFSLGCGRTDSDPSPGDTGAAETSRDDCGQGDRTLICPDFQMCFRPDDYGVDKSNNSCVVPCDGPGTCKLGGSCARTKNGWYCLPVDIYKAREITAANP